MTTRITTLGIMDEAKHIQDKQQSMAKDDKIAFLQATVEKLQKQLAGFARDATSSETSEKPQEYDLIDQILDEVEENEHKKGSEPTQPMPAQEQQHHHHHHRMHSTEPGDDDCDATSTQAYRDGRSSLFWSDISTKLGDGTRASLDLIQTLIQSQRLAMHEADDAGNTVLMLCARHGRYQLAQICVNLCSDVQRVNQDGDTALNIAVQHNHHDIEELLLLQQFNEDMVQRLSTTTNHVARQQCINKHFIRVLKEIFASQSTATAMDDRSHHDSQNGARALSYTVPGHPAVAMDAADDHLRNTFLYTVAHALSGELLETLLNIMVTSIAQRLPFSHDVLYICFFYELYSKKRSAAASVLYSATKEAVRAILADTGNIRDWHWLREYVLPSSIWYFKHDVDDRKAKYLWCDLFAWIKAEVKTQAQRLGVCMRAVASAHASPWSRLLAFGVRTKYSDMDGAIRQDGISHGLRPQYTQTQLLQAVSSRQAATFNPVHYYDVMQYLTQLVLVCHSVDEQFQSDVQDILDIDAHTTQNARLKCQYVRNAVKSYDVCRRECTELHKHATFPSSARLLDIVSGCLVFEDVASMMKGMQQFQQKIGEKVYSVLEVVRVDNGFCYYSHDAAAYSDVKFHVVIQGADCNVVGELRFVLKCMQEHSQVMRVLDSANNWRQFMDTFCTMHPRQKNIQQQLFMYAARDDVERFARLMVTHDLGVHDLLQCNDENESILTRVCAHNGRRVLAYVLRAVPKPALREKLLLMDRSQSYPLKKAIEHNHFQGVLLKILTGDAYDVISHKDADGQTPLQLCWRYRRGPCALLILQNMASDAARLHCIEHVGRENVTSLQCALRCGDYACVQYMFAQLNQQQQQPALKLKLLGTRDEREQCVFHYACQSETDSVACLQLLLDECSDHQLRASLWTAHDHHRCVPLYHAVVNANAEIANFLLSQLSETEKMTFFDTPNVYGKFVIDELIATHDESTCLRTLQVVVSHVRVDATALRALLLVAAKQNELELATAVVQKCSSADAKLQVLNYRDLDGEGECALAQCCTRNHVKFLTFLLSELDDDFTCFLFRAKDGKCALMEAAHKGHARCCKLILDKLSSKKKALKRMLRIRDVADKNALDLAIEAMESGKSNRCAKLLLRYFDLMDDAFEIFLPCLQLSDLETAQKIWDNNRDVRTQRELLRATNKDEYNGFLLLCKEGNCGGLRWLSQLCPRDADDVDHPEAEQAEAEDEAEEEPRRWLKQKHPGSEMTPLLLVCANADATKSKGEKQSYHQCAELILSKSSNPKDAILETCETGKNCLHYCCLNGNADTLDLLLSQLSDKEQRAALAAHDEDGYQCFEFAVQSGQLALVQTVYELYVQHERRAQLLQNSRWLMLALRNGYEEMTPWLMSTFLGEDPVRKLQFLNRHISSTKRDNKFEQRLKQMLVAIVEDEWPSAATATTRVIDDARDVAQIFAWLLQQQPTDHYALKLILSTLCADEYSKSCFVQESRAIAFACTHNLHRELQLVLAYLRDYLVPLFAGCNNALMLAVNARSVKCVQCILEFVTDVAVKNRLIEACNIGNENALLRAISVKSEELVALLCLHHSEPETILGEAFIHALKQNSVTFARALLDRAPRRSTVLNHRSEWGRSALNIALKQKSDECTKFVVKELKADPRRTDEDEDEAVSPRTDEMVRAHRYNPSWTDASVHAMYLSVTDAGRNILHEMFCVEVAMNNLHLLESELGPKLIRKLLLSRCVQGSFLPIHYAIEKSPMAVTKWIISRFDDDPLQQFAMLSKRTQYHSILVSQTIKDKAIKTYVGNVLISCLQKLSFKQIDRVVVKDIFNCTIDWQCIELQKLILAKTPRREHAYLFNKDDQLYNWGHVLHQVMRSDQREMGKLLLSAIGDDEQLMARDIYGLYVLPRGMLQGSTKVIKLVLDRLKHAPEMITKQIYGCDSGGYRGFYYAFSYKRMECALKVVKYLDDEQLHIAVNEAAKHDRELTLMPMLLSHASSDAVRKRLVRAKNDKGQTVLTVAILNGRRRLIEWLWTQYGDDEAVFTDRDWETHSSPCLYVAKLDDAFADVLQSLMRKLSSSKQRFEELFRNSFDRKCIITCVHRKPEMSRVCDEIVCAALNAMDALDDMQVLFPLFEFCCVSKNMKTLMMVLSKTSKKLQQKLFMNYENGRSWNVAKHLISCDADKKQMLSALFKIIDPETKLAILNDERNPSIGDCNALQHCIEHADLELFGVLMAEYEGSQEDVSRLLKTSDQNYKTPLYLAIESGNDEVAVEILQRIEDETEAMSTLNRKSKDTETNVFNHVASPTIKLGLRRLIRTMLKNVKLSGMDASHFGPFFKWCCAENNVDDVKKLIAAFSAHDKHYVHKLLKHVSGAEKQSALHIVASRNHHELLQFFLKFIENEQMKRDMLLFQDLHGNNPLLLACMNHSAECIDALLLKLGGNSRLLSSMVLDANFSNQSCVDYLVSDSRSRGLQLLLSHCSDELVLKSVFSAAVEAGVHDCAHTLLAKAQTLKIRLQQHMDGDGCIPLYYALKTGNTKFAQLMLDGDDDGNRAHYLIEYRNFLGESLLHAACQSTSISAAMLVLSICHRSQDQKHALLFSCDDEGNLPLQLYLHSVSNDRPSEICEFVRWYMSHVDGDQQKLRLLAHTNLLNVSTLNYSVIKSYHFGCSLFKRTIAEIECCGGDDGDGDEIAAWAKLLEVAIQISKDTLSAVKLVLHKYGHDRAAIVRLLATPNHFAQNAFYNVSANCPSRAVMKYVLSFIGDDQSHLLLQPSYSSAMDGNTAVHRVINDVVRGCMVTRKFEGVKCDRSHDDDDDDDDDEDADDEKLNGALATVLFAKNDAHQYVLDHARSSEVTLILLKSLTSQQLMQTFADNITDKKLYCYFLDHQREFMPQLLWTRCTNDQRTYLMATLYNFNSARYLFQWTIDWVRTLSDADRVRLLSGANIYGETILHYCAFFNSPELLQTILQLYPTPQHREHALLCQTNNGITPFHKAYTSNNTAVGHMLWQHLGSLENRLRVVNTDCVSFKNNIDSVGVNAYIENWMGLVQDALKHMKEKYLKDCTLLIPWFYVAVRANDLGFAKFLISKVNKKDSSAVLQFVTTKMASMNGENCLHFAAYSKMSEFMGFLFHLVKNINLEVTDLLLDESVVRNKYDETPLSIACKKNHFFVARYILSKMQSKTDRVRLIEMVWRYDISKTKQNYKRKQDYQLGVNAIFTCCLFQHLGCLKELLSYYDARTIESVLAFRNNKKQSIYRYMKNVETCKFFEKNFKSSVRFGFQQFNELDADGMSPFMSSVKHAVKLRFMIWMLNQCRTDSEKLKLIYNRNTHGDNALDVAPFGSDQELFLIKTIKTILSTYQRIKDTTFIIPIFLHSLKTGRTSLSQFLLSLLSGSADRTRLVNCGNSHGLSTALAACKGGHAAALHFLLAHPLFEATLLFKKDLQGRTAVHLACFSDSISVLHTVLRLYGENGFGDWSQLMQLRDALGNSPFDYMVQHTTLTVNAAFSWALRNCFKLQQFASRRQQKRCMLHMLFGNKNERNQVAIVEIMLRQNHMAITQCIQEYFAEISRVADDDIELVGRILMYLYNFNWTLSQHIVSKIQDSVQLFQILSVENSDKYNLLIYVCKDSAIEIIEWLLSIVPNDHPSLFSKETVYGKTSLMYLIERALLFAAEKLLDKVTNRAQRLQLIEFTDFENKSILDDARQQNIPNRLQWVQAQMNKN